MRLVGGFFDRLIRYPVLLGGAVLATVEASAPEMSPAWKIAITAWVTLGQSMLSKSKKSADEDKAAAEQSGYQNAVVDVSALAAPDEFRDGAA